MACPNFKNGPKKGLGPLGVKMIFVSKNKPRDMIIKD
jgi:hypothetical protein